MALYSFPIFGNAYLDSLSLIELGEVIEHQINLFRLVSGFPVTLAAAAFLCV